MQIIGELSKPTLPRHQPISMRVGYSCNDVTTHIIGREIFAEAERGHKASHESAFKSGGVLTHPARQNHRTKYDDLGCRDQDARLQSIYSKDSTTCALSRRFR